MSRLVSDINIENFGNTNVFRANIFDVDIFGSRFDDDIKISANLIPNATGITIGNINSRVDNYYGNDVNVSGNGIIHNIVANTMKPEDSETITFFGNLFPSIDLEYYIGIPTQRWKQLNVDDINISGNVTGFSPALIDANTIIEDDVDPTKRFRFQASNITTATLREYVVPDGDTELVGNDFPQIITNKTIIGNTNTLEAHRLATTTNAVIINTAEFPTSGQVLAYFTTTDGVWADPSEVIGGSAVTDNQYTSASGLITIPNSQTTFTNVTAMSLVASVPGDSADYLLLFNCTAYGSNNNTSIDFAFAVNGTTVSGTVVRITPETKERNATVFYTATSISDGDVITAQWRIAAGSGGGRLTFRSMAILGFGTQ